MKVKEIVKTANQYIKDVKTKSLILAIILGTICVTDYIDSETVCAKLMVTDDGEDIFSLIPINKTTQQYGLYYTEGDAVKTDLNLGNCGTIEFNDLKKVVEVYDDLTTSYTYSMDSSLISDYGLNDEQVQLYEKIYNMNNDEMYLNFRSEEGKRDIVDVALDEIGTLYNDGTKYGYWYSKIVDNGYDYTKEAWCAMFVSYVAKAAGVTSNKIFPYSYVPSGANKFQEEAQKGNGVWHSSGTNYKPQRGDIFLTYLGENSHTGIVLGSSDEGIYTIEGNTSADDGSYSIGNGGGCVNTKLRSYTYIQGGYYTPNIYINPNGLEKSQSYCMSNDLKK